MKKMAISEDDAKTYITLKRKLSPQKASFSTTSYAVETSDVHNQPTLPRQSTDYDSSGLGSPPKKRLFVAVDADGNQVQVEVPHSALPEGVNPDDANSYIVNAEDINLDLSSYSYSVVVDGIVEDVDLNDCQYMEEPVKGGLKSDELDEGESESGDEHDDVDEKDASYIIPEPDDADPMFKSQYRMSRIVASVSVSSVVTPSACRNFLIAYSVEMVGHRRCI